jgi:hypothetical protein
MGAAPIGIASGRARLRAVTAFSIVALTLLAAAVSSAQDDSVQACLARVGRGDRKGFAAFDRELRAAVAGQDPTLLAVLAAYPLRVNADGGTTSIDNAETLFARAAVVFPPAVRADVLGTTPDQLVCTSGGIGYGRGAVWVSVQEQGDESRFLIVSVNLPDTSPADGPRVVFVCRTDDRRVVVDRGPDGGVRFRAWLLPRPVTARPDLELRQGRATSEGTGACAHRVWTFASGKATYDVREPGCSAGSDEPPAGTIGTLLVSAVGQPSRRSWCY